MNSNIVVVELLYPMTNQIFLNQDVAISIPTSRVLSARQGAELTEELDAATDPEAGGSCPIYPAW